MVEVFIFVVIVKNKTDINGKDLKNRKNHFVKRV